MIYPYNTSIYVLHWALHEDKIVFSQHDRIVVKGIMNKWLPLSSLGNFAILNTHF